jgi:small subunit ribosomal protein S9
VIKEQDRYYATGKRKTAVARIWMSPGQGKVQVNHREVDDYFPRPTLKMLINQPLALTNMLGRFDLYILTNGGGIAGQADAIRHGIAKALLAYSPDFRTALKRAGMLTRDARKVERKKYGQAGARARFQYSKR